MKKLLSITLLFILTLTLILTGCKGQKKVQDIEINSGFKFEYELNEKPDFSGVKATIVYNDGTKKTDVGSSELKFSGLDTSTPGKKDVNVTYEDFTKSFEVTVKNTSADIGGRQVESIEYFSGLPANIYVGDTIVFDKIQLLINYVDSKGEKTEETVSLGANSNIKHNGADINTSVAGSYTLTFTFMGKSTSVNVVVNDITLVELQIDADSVDTTIYENQNFDPTGMVAHAVYSNGTKIKLDVADLTISRNGNIVTISYEGKSVDLTLSYDKPYATGMTISSTGYEKNVLVLGDKLSTAGFLADVKFSNNTTKSVSNVDLTFDYDISKEGTATVKVTYNSDSAITATVDFTVLGISKIAIDTSSVATKVKVGNSFSAGSLAVIITCSDGSKVSRDVADGVIVNGADSVNTAAKDTYYISATYGGVKSSNLAIIVYEEENYQIVGIDPPQSIKNFDSNKNAFINKTTGYLVGDDNPFIFRLELQAMDANGNLLEKSPNYTSYSEVYYNGSLLTGEDLAKYVTIEETDNSFDFTEEAIGKTFKITTRPLFGVENRPDATKELTVTVVDGYNIYEAWELNYLTNYNEFDFNGETGINLTQTQIVDNFLATKNAVRPTAMAGVVLHNDLIINRADLPAEYFVDSNRASGEFWEWLSIYCHATDDTTKNFTFYGNYFTIFSYNLPTVCAEGTGNQNNPVSNGQLFRFSNSVAESAGANFDYSQYKTTIRDLYLKDDNPNNDNVMTSGRDMRGLIAMKVLYQVADIQNIFVEAYYISFFVDGDCTVANVNESIFYNSWQNHIYLWNSNGIQGSDETPSAYHCPATLNITNSKVTKCGGPVIIAQTTDDVDKNANSHSGPQVNIADTTEIWTYVTGQEAWFKALGATGTAATIQQLGLLLKANFGVSYITQVDENGVHGDVVYMNLIMINLITGSDASAVLGSTEDLDGKLTIGGTTYLDMMDTAGNYGNPYVSQLISAYNGQAPVFATAPGGVGIYNGTTIHTALSGDPTTDAMNKEAMKMGDYIAMYQNNFGIVLGYGYTE